MNKLLVAKEISIYSDDRIVLDSIFVEQNFLKKFLKCLTLLFLLMKIQV